MSSSAQALKRLIAGKPTEYLLEAHNTVSAQIAAEAGFAGLWASSLTISSSLGFRDNNELSMTQMLDLLEAMTERVTIPILFDGDTGYGGFNHFQLLVRRLCQRRVAGVCIEDKIFPKTNSFIRSEQQKLAPVEEFCGKLRAGRDAQRDPDFVIVARTEALITGLGMSEALDRASRYAETGVDAVLIHSKSATCDEIASFMAQWDARVPVICIPTTYYGTPPEIFAALGVSVVIWANQMLRGAVEAMQNVARQLHAKRSARTVEDHIVPVKELFRLQNAHGLLAAEEVYGGSRQPAIMSEVDTIADLEAIAKLSDEQVV